MLRTSRAARFFSISNVTVPTHRPNHCLSMKSEETPYHERFFVQADNVGATIGFHSCVLLLLSFPRFIPAARCDYLPAVGAAALAAASVGATEVAATQNSICGASLPSP